MRLSVVALLGLAACQLPAAPAVQIVGESTKLRDDEGLPVRSPFVDGRTVRLHAARGETLGLQVLLAAGTPARTIRLELPPEAAAVTGFRVQSLAVREPSTDMYGPSYGAGDYPDILTPAADGVVATRAAYFDIAVPPAARAGAVRGRLTVGDERWDVELVVAPVTIDLATAPLVWVYYEPFNLARVHDVPDDDGPAEIALEARYQALFRAHGAYLAGDLRPHRLPPRRAFLTGGVRYWPVGLDLSTPERLAADVRAAVAVFADLPTVVPFAIPVDEPHTKAARARVVELGRAIAAASGGKLLTAVTDRPRPEYGDHGGAIDVFLAGLAAPRAAGSLERRWTYNGAPPAAGSMVLDTAGGALRTWGWIAFRYDVELWYVWEGMYFTDRNNDRMRGPTDVLHDPMTFRSRDERGNGDGLLAYPAVDREDPADPSHGGPLPSLRLKALRRGLQDRLLLRKLAAPACGGAALATAIARRLVPRALGETRAGQPPAWPNDEAAWEHARRELLAALAQRCPEPDTVSPW